MDNKVFYTAAGLIALGFGYMVYSKSQSKKDAAKKEQDAAVAKAKAEQLAAKEAAEIKQKEYLSPLVEKGLEEAFIMDGQRDNRGIRLLNAVKKRLLSIDELQVLNDLFDLVIHKTYAGLKTESELHESMQKIYDKYAPMDTKTGGTVTGFYDTDE